MTTYKVFLLDDHKIIRDGIKSILQESSVFKVTGEEGDPNKFLDSLDKLEMDVLILDLSFPQMSGFQILPRVKKIRPEVKVIVLSMHNDAEYVQKSANLGASGYLPKDSDSQEFLKAILSVMNGETYFKQTVVTPSKNPNADILSQRETEVLQHLANGLSSKQIAGQLDISTRTVETHRLNIMKKLNTTNSAETISVAARLNLI